MDFSTIKDSADFTLIPDGTVLEAMIGKVEIKPGKKDPSKTVLNLEFQISKGEYMYAKIQDAITIAGDDAERLEWGMSKIKRMLEYGRNASMNNLAGYIIPEVMGNGGRQQIKWSDLQLMTVGFQVKIESFTSNKTGDLLNSNKVAVYASKNPESGGYKFYTAIESGQQPWQKPLPEKGSKPTSKSSPVTSNDFEEIPLEAYA